MTRGLLYARWRNDSVYKIQIKRELRRGFGSSLSEFEASWDIFQEQEPFFIYTYAYLQLLSVIERMYPFMKREQNTKHRY